MSQAGTARRPVVDALTVVAIAAIAISLNVAFHEGVHALTCVAVGGRLQAYSALYADCDSPTVTRAKIVSGSAPVGNLLAGTALWMTLRKSRRRASETQYFIWLLMLMNWFYGACYFVFSGIADIGDWAAVIDGWEPGWVWRTLLIIVGIGLYVFFVRLGLQEFGKMLGGEADEQLGRANKLWVLSYVTSAAVILVAGFFCPEGPLSLPVTAGLCAALGALSPFVWAMRWFRTGHFEKLGTEPLEIHRKWGWPAAAVIVVFVYAFVLGRTLYF
jgi:hypothetical protein